MPIIGGTTPASTSVVTADVGSLPGDMVATNCWHNGFRSTGIGAFPGGPGAGTTRSRHRAAVDCADLCLVYGNIQTPGTTVEVAGPNTYTIKAAVEWNGTLVPATFTGNLTGTCSPGGLLVSDPIPVEYAKGTDILVRTYASADGTNVITGNMILYAGQSNVFVPTSDLTPTGSAAMADAAGPHVGYGPCAILGASSPTSAPGVTLAGDSISYGTGDGGSGGSGSEFGAFGASPLFSGGFLVRALGRNFGYSNTAQGSETAARYVAAHRRAVLIGGSKHLVCAYGINDLSAGRTTAQVQADYLTIWRLARLRGASAWQCTVTPSTSSSDSFLTTGGQTPFGGESNRLALNAWLRDGAPLNAGMLAAVATGTVGALRCATYGTTGALVSAASGGTGHPCSGVFDTGGAVESTVGASTWRVDGVTPSYVAGDGTHPSTLGHTFMAAAVPTSVFV